MINIKTTVTWEKEMCRISGGEGYTDEEKKHETGDISRIYESVRKKNEGRNENNAKKA
jgi:hypothetical protein